MQSDPSAMRMSSYAFPDRLEAGDLTIRLPVEADVEAIAPAFLDPEVGGEAGLPAIDAEMLRAALAEQIPAMRAQGLLSPYVIEDSSTGAVLGGAAIHHFDPMRDTVEIGYWLFTEARGRGVATRAVEAIVEHAFGNGIFRVEAHVRLGNTASERVLERSGFEREGVKRRYLRHEGRRVDATLFSRLAEPQGS
jgi:RimJ/RimL family protein N-acetyltransferase